MHIGWGGGAGLYSEVSVDSISSPLNYTFPARTRLHTHRLKKYT